MRCAWLLVLVTVACGSTDSVKLETGEPYTNEEQAYSVLQPPGWIATSVRGSTQFTIKPDGQPTKRAKHTIVVRATTKPSELTEGKPTTRDDVIAATQKVLLALPRSTLTSTQPLPNAELSGTRFTVTFVPPAQRKEYRREHAVLVGTQHIYHVIYTAPASEAIDEAAFTEIVNTLTERG